MKKYVYKSMVGITACMLLVSSCTKDINEINESNPNQFTDSDPTLMITGAQLANVMLNEGDAAPIHPVQRPSYCGVDGPSLRQSPCQS